MAQAQGKTNAPVVMDARKFVRHINSGAAAALKLFEDAVGRLGKEAGRTLRLATLNNTSLMYEDVESGSYFWADIKRNGHKIELDNVRPIQIIEEEKAAQFQKNVGDLVEHICTGDFQAADKTFDRIEAQRYRSSVVPKSGWLTLKDGVARRVKVSGREDESHIVESISKLFCESMTESVEVENGKILRGIVIDDPQFKLPVSEFSKRMLVARKMRNLATEAYLSDGFQNFIVEVASLVCESKVADACKVAAKFLREEQEFTTLDRDNLRSLVENTLATRGQFNSMLASDVTTLLYKTNLRVNRDSIVEAWTKVAQKCENADLLSNVSILSESEQFEEDFNDFVKMLFVEDRNATVASMYKLALEYVQDRIPDLEGNEEAANAKDKLGEIISKLSRPEPDTYALIQAEEIFHTINDTITSSIDNLQNFQTEPGFEQSEDRTGMDQPDSEIVPLPEVGGEDEEALDFGPTPGAMGEPQLAGAPMGGAPGAPMESKLPAIEEMNLQSLCEEFESWRINGETYLTEDGYNDCYAQMERYIKRCIGLGPAANVVREGFEQMRDRMVKTGDQLLEDVDTTEDRYTGALALALGADDASLSKSDKDPENDPAFHKKPSVVESRINPNYRHTYLESNQPYGSALVDKGLDPASEPLRMDDLQGNGGLVTKSTAKSDGRTAGGSAAGYADKQRGTGVAGKGVKPVDGRKGEKSNSGAPGGSTRMDDGQGSGGVQKKSVHSTDGRKGSVGSSGTASEAAGMSSKPNGANLRMDDLQGKGGVQGKSTTKASGTDSTGAEAAKKYTASGGPSEVGVRMDDVRGNKGGVCNLHPDENCHCDPFNRSDAKKKIGNDGGLKPVGKGDASGMGKGQGSGGVAESITPEFISKLIAEMDGDKCSDCDCEPCECPPKGGKGPGSPDGNTPPPSGDGASTDGKKKWKKPWEKDGQESKPEGTPPKSESQRHPPSMKKRGLKGAAINSVKEGREIDAIADTISENDQVTALLFKGSPQDIAASIDAALNGVAGGGAAPVVGAGPDVADVIDEPAPPVDVEPAVPAPEEDDVDLEGALDSALGLDDGEAEVPGDDDESLMGDESEESEESDEGEPAPFGAEDESEESDESEDEESEDEDE